MMRGFLTLAGLLLWVLSAQAAITNVQVIGATPTQALVSYVAPDANSCTVEVSESASYQPVVPDVDPKLFAGADRDQRSGNIFAGQQRLLVIGKRAAEIARNGHRYSRALQTAAAHYFRITCGSDQVTGSFQTANIPLGKTYGEVLPVDRDHPGQYAWPEMVWSDPSPRITDPLTGLLFKPLTRPGGIGQRFTGQPFPPAEKGPDSVYLRTTGFSIPYGADWTQPGYSLDYFQVEWKGSGDPVDVCLSVNAVTCASVVKRVALPAKRSAVIVGTRDPGLSFWTDATHTLNRPDTVRRAGTVNVDAAGTVSYGNGDVFNPHWTGGSSLTIDKSTCRIGALHDDRQLTIDPASCRPALTLPAQGISYTADNFGVLVRPSMPGGRFSIDAAVYHYGTALEPGWPAGAHTLFCADRKVPDNSSPPQYGYHCYFQGPIYWINPTTAEVRNLGQPSFLHATVGGDTVEGCWSDAAAFDPANPNLFYCLSQTDKGLPVILRGEYTGNHADIGATDPGSSQIKAKWTNLTPAAQHRDLMTLIHQFDASYDPLFNNCIMRGETAAAKILVTCQRGSQDTLGWEVVFDPATAKMVAAYKSWDKAPGRWCKLHSSAAVIGSDSWARIEFAYNGPDSDPGGGPWQSRIASGAISAKDLQACPANGFGASGNRCITVTVEGEPCDVTPGKGEPLNCPYNPKAAFLMNAEPGDFFLLDQEWLRLLAKNGNQWVIERDVLHRGFGNHAASGNLSAMCSTTLNTDLTFWNFAADPHGMNANGNTVIPDLTLTTHSSVTASSMQGQGDWHLCPAGSNGLCLSVRTGKDVTDWISHPSSTMPSIGPKFAGQSGVASPNFIETYASFPPTSPDAPDRSWFLHNRPITNGGNLTRLTRVSGQLYKAVADPLHRKILPTLATCGVHPLVDESGPRAVLKDDVSDAYRYCVANKAGECASGSGAGDIYVNCPNVAVPLNAACSGGAEDQGVCIADNGTYAQTMAQVSTRIQSNTGQDSRVLTNGFRPYRAGATFWNARALPDGSWALLWAQWLGLERTEALLAKLPPFPTPDKVDRSNFETIRVPVAGRDGATQAVIEFGYAENGPAENFFCTSRQEACVRGNQGGADYAFASEAVPPAPCQSGCTIAVPAIPERVLYYRARYLDNKGQTVGVGPLGAALVP
jgi:hypothetical protein